MLDWLLDAAVLAGAAGAGAFLLSALLKSTVLLAGAAVIVLWLRRGPASARHLVWFLGVAAALMVPPLTLVIPAWRVSFPAPVLLSRPATSWMTGEMGQAEERAQAMQPAVSQAPASAQTTVSNEPARALTKESRLLEAWPLLLMAVWLTGVAVLLGHLITSMARVRGLQRLTRRVFDGPCVDMVATLSARIGLRRVPHVHIADQPVMPMVWGLFRPVLLLPVAAGRWSQNRLEAVILHELAHVRRRDALTQLLAEITRALYWFNPLVWMAARRLYLEREHACDDMVLYAGTRASDYANELLELVRSLRTTRATAMAAIAMARPSQLKVRVQAVLDEARSRQALSRVFGGVAALITLLLVLPLAALRPLVTEAQAEVPILSLKGAVEPAAPLAQMPAITGLQSPAMRDRLGLMAAPAQQESCGSSGNRNTSHNADDGIETIRWSRGRCSGSARIEGNVRFSDDLRSITSISSGGLFRLEEDDGDVERRIDVRPAGGRLEYRYRVEGRDTEFDAAGRVWLGRALVNLVRNTGFVAEQRVEGLMQLGGAQAVLDEVRLLQSDYVKSVYLRRLLDRSSLSSAQVKASVELAGREISSDYELARVLIALANKQPINDETRSAFIAAASSIESDYEQRRVLGTALARGELRNQDVTALLASAQNIGSDYERATLLLSLADRYKLDPAMRQAYLKAASGIGSDYEQRRVYERLMKQGELDSAEMAELLNAAATIRSDYEKAQVLSGLAAGSLNDAALQRAFLNATRSMNSAYEHRRVLTSLLSNQTLKDGNLELALQSAATIESDYELAQVLILVLKNHTLNAQQNELFLKALNTIGSDHEYGRVAAALLRKSQQP